MIAQIYGAGAFDVFLAGPRTDNALVYQGKFGGVSLGALYSFGRDGLTCPGERPGDSEECRGWSAHVNYDAANWGVGTWIDSQNGANTLLGTPPGTADLSGRNDRRVNVNGYVMLGKTKIGANYMDRDNEPAGTENTLWSVAVARPLTAAVTLEAQYYSFNLKDSETARHLCLLQAHRDLPDRRPPAQRRQRQLLAHGGGRRRPAAGRRREPDRHHGRPAALVLNGSDRVPTSGRSRFGRPPVFSHAPLQPARPR